MVDKQTFRCVVYVLLCFSSVTSPRLEAEIPERIFRIGQVSAWQSATLPPINCKSLQPVLLAWVEEPESTVNNVLVLIVHPFP